MQGFRVWIKEGGDANPIAKNLGLRLEHDKQTGLDYMDIFEDIMDPTSHLPEILVEMIREITIRSYRIYRGFRSDGLYRHEDVELMVRTEINVQGGGLMNDEVVREEWQSISATGDNFGTVRSAMRLLLEGKLTPYSNWEAGARDCVPQAY